MEAVSISNQIPELVLDKITTLNHFQKLVGQIQWLRARTPIPPAVMQPLYDILKGNSDLNSPRAWTPAAKAAVSQIFSLAAQAQTARWDPKGRIEISLVNQQSPFCVIHQGPKLLEFVYAKKAHKVLPNYYEMLGELALAAVQRAVHLSGQRPLLYLNFEPGQREAIMQTYWSWAHCSQWAEISPHSSCLLLPMLEQITLVPPQRKVMGEPVQGSNVFTDATKNYKASIYHEASKEITVLETPYDSTQKNELFAILQACSKYPEPINIISDSLYAVKVLKCIEDAVLQPHKSTISSLLRELQQILLQRKNPLYILHVYSHQSTSGGIFEGNDVADRALQCSLLPVLTPPEQAHDFLHLPASSLRHLYGLTREQARQIVRRCVRCVPFLPPPPSKGINPRGLFPNDLWQMDVTHLGRVTNHVCIDTFSKFIMATVSSKENTPSVIKHLYHCFASVGIPHVIKTDNGPAYLSTQMTAFFTSFGIKHVTGIPYNPTGQAIVERAHRTLKATLSKQKGGVGGRGSGRWPTQADVDKALYTYNFLCLDRDTGLSPSMLQLITPPTCNSSGPLKTALHAPSLNQKVLWKDDEGNWQGPSVVLWRGPGYLCLTDSDGQSRWVPERRTKRVEEAPGETTRTGEETQSTENSKRAERKDS
uniref:RNA-directed DNA polymerase n=1 Tax=Vombatus ursinus TaxID=29139 RepID=A0A4X2KGN5_VOMUR